MGETEAELDHRVLHFLVEFHESAAGKGDDYLQPTTGGIYEHKVAQQLGLFEDGKVAPSFLAAVERLERQGLVELLVRRTGYKYRGLRPTPAGIRAHDASSHDGDSDDDVFVSYSHDSSEHSGSVLSLTQDLRRHGVSAWCDQFEQAPTKGWREWMRRRIEKATHILVVCSDTYRRRFEDREIDGVGKGAKYEGRLIGQMLYDGELDLGRVVPILFEGQAEESIPRDLKDATRYSLPRDYDGLLRHLHGRPLVMPVPVGTAPDLPTADASSQTLRVLPGLNAVATQVLRRACEKITSDGQLRGFVGDGENFLADASPPLSPERCREALELLKQYGYVSGEPTLQNRWVSFSVTPAGFVSIGELFVAEFEERRERLIREIVARTSNGKAWFIKSISEETGEDLVFSTMVAWELKELGQLNGEFLSGWELSVYTPAPSLKLEYGSDD